MTTQRQINKAQDKVNDAQVLINSNVEKHLDIANNEMGVIKNDIAWVKGTLEKLDSRFWYIISGVALGVITQIVLRFYK